MFEVILTQVSLELQNGVTYPVTKVYRVQFDSADGFDDLLYDLKEEAKLIQGGKYKIASIEQLGAS